MEKKSPKLITFYLPQFYINDLNNRIWGEGFTEWTNVAQARPNFTGHYQPHIPGALGFYDLSDPRNIEKQISLATSYGIYGFCFYYYWFDGTRALDIPLDLFLKNNSEFPFCICWANENWSRKWDGGNDEVILHQTYGDGFEEKFIYSIKDILTKKNYIRIDGKPVLLLYRPGLFHCTNESIIKIREAARENGIGELHLLAIDFYVGEKQVEDWGFDGIVEFPPHQFYDRELLVDELPGDLINPNFKGHVLDYRKVIRRAINKWTDTSAFKRYRGIVPSWDNTARRKDTPLTISYSSPFLYKLWLKYALTYSKKNKTEFVFINAWNEWGEGCHLEPDRLNGSNYLEATKEALLEYDDEEIGELRRKTEEVLDSSSIKTPHKKQTATDTVTPISFKDFVKSRLFQYPSLYKLLRNVYHTISLKP